jgi:hypothetical protein
MLDSAVIRKIEEFVYSKPRTIQEIAEHIDKNWRTADRYIDEIEKEFGTIATRVFRGGTRGALKIVYWASIEKVSGSVFQKELEEAIFRSSKGDKRDFNAFDIYQHVDDKKKDVLVKVADDESGGGLVPLRELFMSAKKQILFFSGNLSFINFKDDKVDAFDVLDELVKKGVSIKVVTRVDLEGLNNVEKLYSLNHKYGKELVEIRHRQQPLRCTIIDDSYFNIKETKEPTGRANELDKKIFLFYYIKDKEWVEWMKRIFWKMFSSSIDARKRIGELDKIKI